jgi:hypothetical protein
MPVVMTSILAYTVLKRLAQVQHVDILETEITCDAYGYCIYPGLHRLEKAGTGTVH